MTTIGSFDQLCRSSAVIPVCSSFVLRGDKTCTLQGISLGPTKIVDFVDVILCLIFVVMAVLIAFRTHSKYAAVGRSEMGVLNLFFICLFAIQIISTGGWMTAEPELIRDFILWCTITHTALIPTTAWVLLLNGIVGYQFVPDGSPQSVYGISATAFIIFIGTGFIAADTALGITNFFQPGPSLMSIPLMVLTLVIPVLAIVLYVVLQIILVVTQLSVIRPLRLLVLALIAFALGQVCTFVISDSICKGTSRWIDGKIFSTIFTFLAFYLVHRYWCEITEDEWEDFEDQF